jgi:hypothetical protein
MRSNFVLVLIAVATFVAFGGAASAVTFVSDTFSYPAGDLTSGQLGGGGNVSGGLWRWHSGGGNIQVTPAGEVVSVNGGSGVTDGEDANRHANGNVIGLNETWYYAALLSIDDTRADPNTTALESQSYVLHFKDSGTFNFVTRAHVTDPSTGIGGAGFRFGLSAGSGNFQAATADLNFGQQYKLVGSFNATTGAAQLWVDPVNSGSPSIAHTDVGRIGTLIEALAIRQDNGSATTFNAVIDSVAFGDDFDSVLLNSMNGSNIPEPASLALALLGLAGITSTRRRS